VISESVKSRLKHLEDSILKATEEAEQLETMTLLFPDLEVEVNRWGTKKLTSRMVNSMAVDYDTGHSCGCCEDAPLFAYPYVEFEGIRVHSKPSKVYIGERCYHVVGGELYDQRCLGELRTEGFNPELIAKIEKLVDEVPSYLPYDDDDEAEGDS
jgi:hypothetical protein